MKRLSLLTIAMLLFFAQMNIYTSTVRRQRIIPGQKPTATQAAEETVPTTQKQPDELGGMHEDAGTAAAKVEVTPEQALEKKEDAKEEVQLPVTLEVQPDVVPEKTSESYPFDIAAKRKQVMRLVDKGVKFFNETKSLSVILNNFCSNHDFKLAELYLFLYDMKGVCLATGSYKEQIWQNMYEARDKFSVPYVKQMIEKAKQGGGWINYEWYNGTKVAYVTKVSKDGKDYVLSCGFFPFSKETAVVSMVEAATILFNHEVIGRGLATSAMWGILSYPKGRFVYGDLFIYAFSVKGHMVAHGQNSDYIGSDAFNAKDDQGKFYNREIIEKLKKADKGVWVKNFINNTLKKTYAQKVSDKKGNEYVIACGYFPDIDKKAVVDLTRKSYVFVKSNGLKAAQEATAKEYKEFVSGDLKVFAYDLNGICAIDTDNPINVGNDMLNEKDEDGVLYIQAFIQKAKQGGGWIDVRINNSFKSCYVESVSLGTGEYVIGTGYYPSTKRETMGLLAKSASSFFKAAPSIEEALAEFTKPDSTFTRGDLFIYVSNKDGICLAFGPEKDVIWRQHFLTPDAKGVPLFKLWNDALKSGPGYVPFIRKNVTSVSYVEEVEKDGEIYIVGSHYYV